MLDWIIPFIEGFFSLEIVQYPIVALFFVALLNFAYAAICRDGNI